MYTRILKNFVDIF